MITKIESFWKRIDEIEKRIEYLANKGLDYSIETRKRKNLLRNFRLLELSNYNKKELKNEIIKAEHELNIAVDALHQHSNHKKEPNK